MKFVENVTLIIVIIVSPKTLVVNVIKKENYKTLDDIQEKTFSFDDKL